MRFKNKVFQILLKFKEECFNFKNKIQEISQLQKQNL